MDNKRAKELIERVCEGDNAALEDFYREFSSAIFDAAFKVLRDRHAAEDILNTIFFEVYKKAEMLHKLDSPLGYIYTMSYNRAIDYARKQRDVWLDERVVSSEYNEGEITQRILIDNIMLELDEVGRRVLLLKIVHGYSFVQISKLLDMPYKKVRAKYIQAAKDFKSKYDSATTE